MSLFYDNVRKKTGFINLCIFERLEEKFNKLISMCWETKYNSPQEFKVMMNEFKELVEEAKILNSENENNSSVENYISMYETVINYPNFLMNLSRMPQSKFGKFTNIIRGIKEIKNEYIDSHENEYEDFRRVYSILYGGCGEEPRMIFPVEDFIIEINANNIVSNGEIVEKRDNYEEEELEEYEGSVKKLETDIAVKVLSRKYKNRLIILNEHLRNPVGKFKEDLNNAIYGYSDSGLNVNYSRNVEQQDIENEK